MECTCTSTVDNQIKENYSTCTVIVLRNYLSDLSILAKEILPFGKKHDIFNEEEFFQLMSATG